MTTTIKAELLLASKNAVTGDILYTFLLTYPRMILAEVNTHRVASRNTSSSRAIPSKKYRKNVLEDPFIPVHIGANKAGMQAGAELTGWRRKAAEKIWSLSRYPQLGAAWAMERLGVHKQVANRLLEPWVWVQQVFSATEMDNLLKLRNHHMAEPHFHELASQMNKEVGWAKVFLNAMVALNKSGAINSKRENLGSSTYQLLEPGQWHLPFVEEKDWDQYFHEMYDIDLLKKISAARCARTSYYLPENGKLSTIERDIELFERLAVREEGSDDPLHLSPLEHQATPLNESVFCGNFKGFKQFRKELPGEDGRGNAAQ